MNILEPNTNASYERSRRIEVVTTDTNGLRENGFGSIETCRNIAKALLPAFPSTRFTVARGIYDLEDIVARAPALVVVCVKFLIDDTSGSTIWLSDYFGYNGIPVTGSEHPAITRDTNKSRAKTAVMVKGVRTPLSFLARSSSYRSPAELPLPFPLFVKPIDAANSLGVDENSVVRDFPSFKFKVTQIISTFGKAALVEEFVSGREFTVAILGNGKSLPPNIMPMEIITGRNTNGDRLRAYQANFERSEQRKTARGELRELVSDLALSAFNALGGRDFGRIDVRLDNAGNPHFLEANLLPGMTPGRSDFPDACRQNCYMSYEEVVQKIVRLGIGRTNLIHRA